MKRILIVRTDRVGDVVMTTPLIRELRKTFPDCFIATLTRPQTKDVLLHNPHLDAMIVDDLGKETFWKLVGEIRERKFTDGLLLFPTERAAYQMFLAGVRNRVGVGHKLYEVITFMKSVSRNNYVPLRHEADYCMDLARKIGVETTHIAPEIFVTDDERSDAAAVLRRNGVQEGCVKLMIHTGSGGSAPNWSESKYLELIRRIALECKDESMRILLTAREIGEAFLRALQDSVHGRIVNLSPDIRTLRDLIKIISQADLFIGPSTGPMHIADALGVRCIGLHCHRPMNCVQHWGILNGRSVNLEVSAEACKQYCSADQNTCGIEYGLGIDEVIRHLKTFISC